MNNDTPFELLDQEQFYLDSKKISTSEQFADRLITSLMIVNFCISRNGFDGFNPYGLEDTPILDNVYDEKSALKKWVTIGLNVKHFSDFLKVHQIKDVLSKADNVVIGNKIWRSIKSLVALKPIVQVALGKKRITNELMFSAVLDYSNLASDCDQLVSFYSNEPKLVNYWQKVQRLSQGGKEGVKKTHEKTQPRAQSDNEKIYKAAIKLLSYAHYSYDDLIYAIKREVKPENKKKFSDSKIKEAFKKYGGILKLRKDAKKTCTE